MEHLLARTQDGNDQIPTPAANVFPLSGRYVSADPQPIYDEIYEDGVRWLNGEGDTEEASGEYVLCDWCGQLVLRREAHRALCGLPCVGGKIFLDDEIVHDQDCPNCL
jgi:hypothetical protein